MISLCDIVLATEEEVENTYKTENAMKFYAPLLEHGFLPIFTAETLTTAKGNQLMHLATWVYLSGNIAGENFATTLSLDDEAMNHLKENYLSDIFDFTPHNHGKFSLNKNCYGRLMYALGIPKSNGDGDERQTKADYRTSLPRFFKRLQHDREGKPYKMTPDEHSRRRCIMREIAGAIVKDRLNSMENRKNGYLTYSIDLRTHSTEEQARNYGKEVVDFLNEAYSGPNSKFPKLDFDQVRLHHRNDGNQMHLCWITLKPEQIGYLATTGGRLFDIKVRY